jgi:hypothetical protein
MAEITEHYVGLDIHVWRLVFLFFRSVCFGAFVLCFIILYFYCGPFCTLVQAVSYRVAGGFYLVGQDRHARATTTKEVISS